MEFRKVTNKEGEVLTTKEGVELVELRLEAGDVFIPSFNNVMEKVNKDVEVVRNGKTTTQNITNYSIKCTAKDKEGNIIKNGDSEEVFVTLTPSQAKSLKKYSKGSKTEDGTVYEPIALNQNLFIAYEYQSEDYGTQIGVGLKKESKPAKTFADFEKEDEEE